MTTPYMRLLEDERRAARRAPRAVVRRPEVKVGDQIQYRINLGRGLITRQVIEVLEDGGKFVVDGFYNVLAREITCHIPSAESEAERAKSEADTLEFE